LKKEAIMAIANPHLMELSGADRLALESWTVSPN
jgi:hypothetical protein